MHWWWIPTYTSSLFFLSSIQSYAVFFYFFLYLDFKISWGVSFFCVCVCVYIMLSLAQLIRINIPPFVLLWVCRWVFFSRYPHKCAYTQRTVPRYTFFFLRQVLSFRSLIKFTQPFYNSHTKKNFEDFFFAHSIWDSGFSVPLISTGWRSAKCFGNLESVDLLGYLVVYINFRIFKMFGCNNDKKQIFRSNFRFSFFVVLKEKKRVYEQISSAKPLNFRLDDIRLKNGRNQICLHQNGKKPFRLNQFP